MADQQRAIVPAGDDNWRPRVFMIGGLIGAVLGLLSAYFYVQAAGQQGRGERPEAPDAKETVRLGLSLLSIIRTITEWGSR